jgi:sterol desaturase/sphingolipid hydroxylase (fatty acid hydroxylase superfamily)
MVVAIVLAFAVAMFAVEATRPARAWPRVAGWWTRAALINGFQIGFPLFAGVTWERWLHRHQLLSTARLGLPAELAIGYFSSLLWLYWSHRARHAVPLLWRWLHQLHHSPQRVELLTAFYKHPFEIAAESIINAVLLYFCLGLSTQAVVIIGAFSSTAGLFYHWNVATPRWLGYLVQRPESHCVHHQEGVHAYNYSELPLIDMLFGTFRNPLRFDARCGFGGDRRFADLLLGRDVSPSRQEDDLAVAPPAHQ